jgi:hypothetical protein
VSTFIRNNQRLGEKKEGQGASSELVEPSRSALVLTHLPSEFRMIYLFTSSCGSSSARNFETLGSLLEKNNPLLFETRKKSQRTTSNDG